jgi:hypothetical protein
MAKPIELVVSSQTGTDRATSGQHPKTGAGALLSTSSLPASRQSASKASSVRSTRLSEAPGLLSAMP